MSRLVVISNRIAPIGEGRLAPGGLAVGVLEALRARSGLWFGWSGRVNPHPSMTPRTRQFGNITVAEMDLTPAQHQGYYLGYSNATLWPAFHYRLDLMNFAREELESYREVNRGFAAALKSLLRPDDLIWVHDYHLIPLAAELRALGVQNRIGFFLHIPLPSHTILIGIPGHRELIRTLCAYDLIGLQTRDDVLCLTDYLERQGIAAVNADGTVRIDGREVAIGAFPISIDTDNLVRQSREIALTDELTRLTESLRGRRLIIGVDRLDYTKGLYRRFRAIERLFSEHAEFRGAIEFLQIAPPTRSELHQYQAIKDELEQSAGRINGIYADYDWVPIRYLHKPYARRMLVGFFRVSAIGLVTPLRDGMNLVAKEYVAAQDAEDPGVLVLSQFAGAARELEAALIVNPYDFESVGDTLAMALSMPRDERVARQKTLFEQITRCDARAWRQAYEAALIGT